MNPQTPAPRSAAPEGKASPSSASSATPQAAKASPANVPPAAPPAAAPQTAPPVAGAAKAASPSPAPQPAKAAAPATRSDRSIRQDALVFYEEDMDAIETILDAFLKQSAVRCALLVDQDGHMITARGETKSIDLDTISALVAGSFAATRALAKVFGDKDFTALFHQGKSGNIQLSLVGERALLTALFGDDTTIGMVRLYSNEASKRLSNIFRKKSAAKPQAPAVQDAKFTQGAADALKNVLG